mgnify:FL=1|tara:strand:- start:1215 stop:2069 length:855 start_codon:yes stop_codon:yes gene_type:complete
MSYTYTQLKASIQDYTDNNETTFVSNLNRFIESAEQRIFSTVDLEYFRKNVSGTMTSGNQFLAVPDDYLASFSLSIENSSSKEFLLQRDVNFLQEYNPNSSTTGVPKYYSLYDINTFIIAPTPNANFSTELHYYYRPVGLADSKFTLTVSNVTGTFVNNETITGGTSAETTTINSITSATQLVVIIPTGTFTVGETVTGGTSGATGVVVSTSADTTLTWVSENAPNAILYGSLFEAYTYMKGEPDMLELYNGRFSEALSRIKDLGEARENTDAYRDGLVRMNRT